MFVWFLTACVKKYNQWNRVLWLFLVDTWHACATMYLYQMYQYLIVHVSICHIHVGTCIDYYMYIVHGIFLMGPKCSIRQRHSYIGTRDNSNYNLKSVHIALKCKDLHL